MVLAKCSRMVAEDGQSSREMLPNDRSTLLQGKMELRGVVIDMLTDRGNICRFASAEVDALSSQAFRVLAMAYRPLPQSHPVDKEANGKSMSGSADALVVAGRDNVRVLRCRCRCP